MPYGKYISLRIVVKKPLKKFSTMPSEAYINWRATKKYLAGYSLNVQPVQMLI